MSIVVAYAMSEVLSGFGQMIRMRDRVRPYPLQLGWSVLVVLLMVQWWWGFWEYRDAAPLGFFSLVAVLSEPMTAFVLVSFRAG